jgi:chromatin structure-remodeling complex protein RSC7
MLDASSPAGEPEDDENEEDDEDEDAARDSEAPSGPTTPVPEEQPVPRKRRLGRPPKNKPPGWDDDDGGRASDVGTPRGRGRGRGSGFRGGRWKNRGGPSHITQQPIDKDGNMMNVVNDEVDLPEDSEGEKKVDKMGNLQGGREYRTRTFKIPGRGERLYMLSTEPARCVGFRDSYLFFSKHKKLHKIIITDDEKLNMIERKLIPHSYKGRAIGICTARSVFREFGARIIIGGKRVTDDYEVAAAKTDGIVEGEIADPNDALPKNGEDYNKNQYVAWHGASSVYHSGVPSVPLQAGKAIAGQKRNIKVTEVTWMLEHARESRYVRVLLRVYKVTNKYSRFNSNLSAIRKKNLSGMYDPHTNSMQYPKIMQPTHARWEHINDYEVEANGTTNGHTHNGEATIFPPVKPIYSRNYMIVDTVYESAPSTNYGFPGPDGDVQDLGLNGLASVSDDIKAELPPECLKAFEHALEKEMQWKNTWGTEMSDTARRAPVIDKGVISL